MPPSSLSLVCFVLIHLTNAIVVPPPLSLLPTTTNDTKTLSQTLSNLTDTSPLCSSAYGSDLRGVSCLDAWEKIGRTKTKRTFRRRDGILSEGTPLPIRYLSDDGLCAIDLDFVAGGDKDPEPLDDYTISEQAGEILVGCVYKSMRGGYAILPSKLLSLVDLPHLSSRPSFISITIYIPKPRSRYDHLTTSFSYIDQVVV